MGALLSMPAPSLSGMQSLYLICGLLLISMVWVQAYDYGWAASFTLSCVGLLVVVVGAYYHRTRIEYSYLETTDDVLEFDAEQGSSYNDSAYFKSRAPGQPQFGQAMPDPARDMRSEGNTFITNAEL